MVTKIALVTDDKETISAHFGRALYYVVVTIEDEKIVERETRDKAGHHTFAAEPHDHEHGEGHGRRDPRGRGFGQQAGSRHARMIANIRDCDVLIARGMGRGAQINLQEAGIKPILTDLKRIDEAVEAYLDGRLIDRPDRVH